MITFQKGGSGPKYLIGVCDTCARVRAVLAKTSIPLKHTTPLRWWARCELMKCRGHVRPAWREEDEAAMVAAYLVGGDEAAAAVFEQTGKGRVIRGDEGV